ISLDPTYALAHAGLSDCYLLLGEYTSARPADILPKARPHAYRALELDRDLAEAHASLGLISLYDYDWASAEREFKRAIDLRSGSSIRSRRRRSSTSPCAPGSSAWPEMPRAPGG